MKHVLRINPNVRYWKQEFDNAEDLESFKEKFIHEVNTALGTDFFKPYMFKVEYEKDEEELNTPEYHSIDMNYDTPLDQVREFTKQDSKDVNSLLNIYDRLNSNDVALIEKGVTNINTFMKQEVNRRWREEKDKEQIPDLIRFNLTEKEEKQNFTLIAEIISTDDSDKILPYLKTIMNETPYVATRYDLDNPKIESNDYYKKITFTRK